MRRPVICAVYNKYTFIHFVILNATFSILRKDILSCINDMNTSFKQLSIIWNIMDSWIEMDRNIMDSHTPPGQDTLIQTSLPSLIKSNLNVFKWESTHQFFYRLEILSWKKRCCGFFFLEQRHSSEWKLELSSKLQKQSSFLLVMLWRDSSHKNLTLKE